MMSRMITAAALVLASTAMAGAQSAEDCTVRDSSEWISVVICPAGLTLEQLREAGTAACGDRLPCGAWIWADADAAPEAAPENHDGLTQDQVAAASGVWVAEDQTLIQIEKVQN